MTGNSDWQGIHKPGAVAFAIAGVLFVVGTPFAFVQESGPGDLAAINAEPLPFVMTALAYGISDLFLIPAILALYVVLRSDSKPLMAVATAYLAAAIIFDLASNMMALSVFGLSGEFALATTSAQRAAYTAAADALLGFRNVAATLDNFIWAVYAILVGWVMVKGSFGKGKGYIGIVSGIMGAVGAWAFVAEGMGDFQLALGILLSVAVILWGIWYIAIAFKLYRINP